MTGAKGLLAQGNVQVSDFLPTDPGGTLGQSVVRDSTASRPKEPRCQPPNDNDTRDVNSDIEEELVGKGAKQYRQFLIKSKRGIKQNMHIGDE